MPKKSRLTGEEIRALRGSRLQGALFSLLVAGSPAPYPKYACVVSKKVSAKAVERNTVKRRSYAALARLSGERVPPRAFVFHAKREALGAPFDEVVADMRALLSRAAARS